MVESPTHFVCERKLKEADLGDGESSGRRAAASRFPRTVCKREITRDEALVYLANRPHRAAHRLHVALRSPLLGDARAARQRPTRLRVPAARARRARRRAGEGAGARRRRRGRAARSAPPRCGGRRPRPPPAQARASRRAKARAAGRKPRAAQARRHAASPRPQARARTGEVGRRSIATRRTAPARCRRRCRRPARDFSLSAPPPSGV